MIRVQKLVAATGNPGKLREFRELLAGSGVEIVSAADAGWTGEVVEDGDTLRENAGKKAREIAAATGMTALADDTGLFVDALDGAPGVHSARYAGPECDAAANCARLLQDLESVPDEARTAAFRCVIALVTPGEEPVFLEGECRGRIVAASRGDGGFGYDSLFAAQGSDFTFAEMGPDEKNRLSHRGKALARLAEYLET